MRLGDVANFRVGGLLSLQSNDFTAIRLECSGRGMFTCKLGQGDGRYRLEAKIGSGGFAVVFRARDLERDEPVAVKVLHRQHVDDDWLRERCDKLVALVVPVTRKKIRCADLDDRAGGKSQIARHRTLRRGVAGIPGRLSIDWFLILLILNLRLSLPVLDSLRELEKQLREAGAELSLVGLPSTRIIIAPPLHGAGKSVPD